jgi:hypothetical protein
MCAVELGGFVASIISPFLSSELPEPFVSQPCTSLSSSPLLLAPPPPLRPPRPWPATPPPAPSVCIPSRRSRLRRLFPCLRRSARSSAGRCARQLRARCAGRGGAGQQGALTTSTLLRFRGDLRVRRTVQPLDPGPEIRLWVWRAHRVTALWWDRGCRSGGSSSAWARGMIQQSEGVGRVWIARDLLLVGILRADGSLVARFADCVLRTCFLLHSQAWPHHAGDVRVRALPEAQPRPRLGHGR